MAEHDSGTQGSLSQGDDQHQIPPSVDEIEEEVLTIRHPLMNSEEHVQNNETSDDHDTEDEKEPSGPLLIATTMKEKYHTMNLKQLYSSLLQEDPTTSNNDSFGKEILEVTGLTKQQVARQKGRYGENDLYSKILENSNHEISMWRVFVSEVREPMIIMLFLVGILYLIWDESIWNGLVIFGCILLMVFVEVWNEFRAKKGVQALKSTFMISKQYSVRRDGEIKLVDVSDIVPGDVIIFKEGQILPADVRLVAVEGLRCSVQVDQSSFVGESVPCTKHGDPIPDNGQEVHFFDCQNIIFAGTSIVKGRGFGVVITTGSNTELGSFLNLLGTANKEKEKKTKLQKAMKQLATYLTIASISISIVIIVVGWIRGFDWRKMLLTGLSVMFATIPEELPIIIKSVLALGSLNLSKKNLLIKKLHVPESMATATYILTDKTGTMTKNCLQLIEVHQINDNGILNCDFKTKQQNQNLGWVNDWVLAGYQNVKMDASDDPFERSVAQELGSYGDTLQQTFDSVLNKRKQGVIKTLEEDLFEHNRGYAFITLMENSDSPIFHCYMKGIPERMLEQSILYQPSNTVNTTVPFSTETKAKVYQYLDDATRSGMRVIALCKKVSADMTTLASQPLIFLSLLAFKDPVRSGVKEAIKHCKEAGIKVVMISGDHTNTAIAVARETGLLTNETEGEEDIELGHHHGSKCIEGKDVQDNMDISDICVVSRATPSNKSDLVQILKKQHKENVIVSGDGINDTIALRKATVGIAMGKGGVDLAKEAADVILTDDNFSTIVVGITEGRKLYDNLRKSIQFYLSCKMTLVTLFVINMIIGGRSSIPFIPLDPIQIILLELFSDIGAASAFVLEEAEETTMKKPPKTDNKFVDKSFLTHLAIGSISLFSAVFFSYMIGIYVLAESVYGLTGQAKDRYAQSMVMLTWLIGHVVLAFNFRTIDSQVLKHGLFTNVMMNIWLGIVIFSAFILQVIPPFYEALKMISVGIVGWIIIILLVTICICWQELFKWIRTQRVSIGSSISGLFSRE